MLSFCILWDITTIALLSARQAGVPVVHEMELSLPLPNQSIYLTAIPQSLGAIESERLQLRPICADDAAAILAIRSRPEVAKNKYVKIVIFQ